MNAGRSKINDENIKVLWLQLHAKLKTFILNKVRDEEAAEDLLQEVFIRIHTKIDTLHDDSKIQAWIYQITRNLISDYFEKVNKEKRPLPPPDLTEEDSSTEYMAEALQDLVKMMDDLPPEYCEALCLTELGGMSQKMYTKRIGISHSGAKSRVQRAKIMLKDLLMKCCHYQFDKYGTVLDISPVNCCYCSGVYS